MRAVVHIGLHLLVPLLVARMVWPERWRRATLIMLATMAVDLDHLLATPVYDPDRCSIGFHPLHSVWAVGLYGALMLFAGTRLWGAGLLIHMALDLIDCLRMQA